jgi:hypothetical protein
MGTAQVAFMEVERGGATGSHVTRSDVSHASAEKVSLRRILCNVRLRMRMTFFRFRTGPLPVTQLPVISGHVTDVTSGHVTSTELDFYRASLMQHQSAGRHVAPLGHIILIPSQSIFALSP